MLLASDKYEEHQALHTVPLPLRHSGTGCLRISGDQFRRRQGSCRRDFQLSVALRSSQISERHRLKMDADGDGVQRQFQTICDVQRSENVMQIVLYRLLGDRQLLSDVLVPETLHDQRHDFALPRTQL